MSRQRPPLGTPPLSQPPPSATISCQHGPCARPPGPERAWASGPLTDPLTAGPVSSPLPTTVREQHLNRIMSRPRPAPGGCPRPRDQGSKASSSSVHWPVDLAPARPSCPRPLAACRRPAGLPCRLPASCPAPALWSPLGAPPRVHHPWTVSPAGALCPAPRGIQLSVQTGRWPRAQDPRGGTVSSQIPAEGSAKEACLVPPWGAVRP